MAEPTARVSLKEGKATLRLPPGSALLRGAHRVFFVNVLGFEISETFSGFEKEISASTPMILKEVLDYMHEAGERVDLDAAAQAMADDLREAKIQLEEALTRGNAIKRRPPRQLAVPDFPSRKLKPYQIPAVAHILGVQNAANFSVPGSGKTTIALAAYSLLVREGAVDKLVVIGPQAAFMPWEEEFLACFDRPPNVVRIVGPKGNRDRLFRMAADAELVLVSYQMASNEADRIARLLRDHKTMLVLDESHNIKRLEGGTWADRIVSLAPHATRRVILSGTPVPNSITDLWTQVTFLWPSEPILGPKEHFKHRASDDDSAVIEETRDKLRPIYWRIKKKDLDLPRQTFNRVEVPMGPYQATIYNALASKVLAEVVKAPEERDRLRAWRKARMVRLLQAASNPTLLHEYSEEFRIPPLDPAGLSVEKLITNYSDFEKPAKLQMAEKLVREFVNKKRKVLVWSVFVHNIRTLARMLSDLDPVTIYGDIPKDDNEDDVFNRERLIRKFKSEPGCRVLIANPAACAESVSLHRVCHDAIYLERTFNAAHFIQSLDRIHRVGLTPRETVRYHLLLSEDSVDLAIDERLNDKHKRMRKLLDDEFRIVDLESPLGEFSEEGEEDADFQALLSSLRATVRVTRHD